MVSQTNEQALEATIEQALTGMTTEEMKSAGDVRQTPADDLVANCGFRLGLPIDFNAQYAIDEKLLRCFLEQTQSTQLAKLQKHNPADWQSKLLERYDRMMKKHILHLMKRACQSINGSWILLAFSIRPGGVYETWGDSQSRCAQGVNRRKPVIDYG